MLEAGFDSAARGSTSQFVDDRAVLAQSTLRLCLATRQAGGGLDLAAEGATSVIDRYGQDPDDPTARRLVVQALNVRAATRSLQSRFEQAAIDYDAAADLTARADSDTRALARWGEGQALAALQAWDRAASAYVDALIELDRPTTTSELREDRSQIECERQEVEARRPPRGPDSPCGPAS